MHDLLFEFGRASGNKYVQARPTELQPRAVAEYLLKQLAQLLERGIEDLLSLSPILPIAIAPLQLVERCLPLQERR